MDNDMDFWNGVLEVVKAKRYTVGIGIKKVTPSIIESLKRAQQYVDVVVVGQVIEGFKSINSDTLEPLVRMAKGGELDAVVRGNFDAVEAYGAVKEVLGFSGSIFELNLYRLNGVKLIDPSAKGVFCILPVSFTNERSVEDKISSIELHLEFFKKVGVEPKVGILAPGKPEDVSANIPEVTEGLKEAAHLVEMYSTRGVWIKNFNHQIEKAVLEANIIVAPNSWAGNLAAHCLIYLGNCDFLGAVALNIEEIVYIDDSEAMEDFTNCLILAAYLADRKGLK